MFTASFTISPTSSPASFVLTDSSVGSDGTITSRTVYLYQSDGTLFTPAITWAIANSSITISVLTQDTALNVKVVWNTPTPTPGNTYEKTILGCFDGFGQEFGFNTSADINSNPQLVQDANYITSMMRFYVFIQGAEYATTTGNNITLTQELLDLETDMQTNSQYLFS